MLKSFFATKLINDTVHRNRSHSFASHSFPLKPKPFWDMSICKVVPYALVLAEMSGKRMNESDSGEGVTFYPTAPIYRCFSLITRAYHSCDVRLHVGNVHAHKTRAMS